MDDFTSAPSRPSGRRKSVVTTKPVPDLPPLPSGGEEFLRDIQEALIKRLAERKVDTNPYAAPNSEAGPSWKLKENEQNVRNRAREKLFTEQIDGYVDPCTSCIVLFKTDMYVA